MKQRHNHYHSKREYIRVPYEKRMTLLRMVFLKGQKINYVAELLGIKYATAKTIVYQQKKRTQKKCMYTAGTKECKYSQRINGGNVRIISTIGGFTQ